MAALSGRPRRAQATPEPVTVPAVRNGVFPLAFIWRGRRHEVQAVEACRTEVRRGWRGQVQRHLFRVRSQGGVYELAQDPARGVWSLESAPSGD